MIDGLKLTLTGEELQRMLQDRASEHRQSAARWMRESTRDAEEQTLEEPVLPTHMCEYEAERHEWRADVLEFMRDHLEPLEVYRLGESDLAFGELLPAKPGALEQDEHEERTRVGLRWSGWANGSASARRSFRLRTPTTVRRCRTVSDLGRNEHRGAG